MNICINIEKSWEVYTPRFPLTGHWNKHKVKTPVQKEQLLQLAKMRLRTTILTSTAASSSSESCRPRAAFCNFFLSLAKACSVSSNLNPLPENPLLFLIIFPSFQGKKKKVYFIVKTLMFRNLWQLNIFQRGVCQCNRNTSSNVRKK